MLTYLGAGAMGLPVFSGSPERGIGLAYLAGPTGGYLFGYLIASGLVGWLATGRGWLGRVTVMLAALGVVYAAGLAWLALYVPSSMLLAAGLTPFLLGDLLKVALAATAVTGANQLKGALK
jgi:biotin transport system substrate-specific component